MPAPKGNKFWELRSTHGRTAIFDEPQKMWDAACEYFDWCEENPFYETDFKGKDADEVHIPKMRPFTLQGLCLYLDCNTQYFKDFKTSNTYKNNKDFSLIVTRIEEVIYNQKFSGAASGFFNPSIIARDLGLNESIDHTSKGGELKSGFNIIVQDQKTAADVDKLMNNGNN